MGKFLMSATRRERLSWIAQTIHQGHPDDHDSGTWETCTMAVCQEIQVLATELQGSIPIPDAIFGPISRPEKIEGLYLVFMINEDGQPVMYIHSFDELTAVDRAKSIYGIVAVAPILHDFRKVSQGNG